jgi:broad specificity phosphatase PhoE
MTRIYLIRHCEADGNINRVFHGHTDAGISENGKKQLAFLSERARGWKLDAVYASPLARALLTAQAVNRFHQLPIQPLAGLMEINGGHWEGCKFADLPQLYPDEFLSWEETPWEFSVAQGESMAQVYDRIWNTVLDIVRENPGQSVCVVSHGCAIRNFLCRASGLPLCRLSEVDWCDNTAVSIVDFDEALHPTVVLQNDTSHLSPEYSTLQKQDWWKKNRKEERP